MDYKTGQFMCYLHQQSERLAFVGFPLHDLCEAEVATWMAPVRVIAALDEDLKRRLGAQQKAALLSDETLAKQKQHQPELTLAQYRLLAEIIAKGKAIELGE